MKSHVWDKGSPPDAYTPAMTSEPDGFAAGGLLGQWLSACALGLGALPTCTVGGLTQEPSLVRATTSVLGPAFVSGRWGLPWNALGADSDG